MDLEYKPVERVDVESLIREAEVIAKRIGAGNRHRDEVISEALLAVAQALRDGVDSNETLRRVRVACRSELRRLWGYANRRLDYPEESRDEVDDGVTADFDPRWICPDRKQSGGPLCAWFPMRQCKTPDGVVWEAIEQLSWKLRIVMELTYWFGYEEDQVAEILQISASAVHDRLNRARKKLKNILSVNPTFLRPSLRMVIEGETRSAPNSATEASEPLEKAA